MDERTRTQILRFLVVGIAATITDASVYFGMIDTGAAHAVLEALAGLVPTEHDVAKACSFLLGTTVSYILNKQWTFESKERDLRQAGAFVALYGTTFVLNVGVNHAVLELGASWALADRLVELAGFLIATAFSTVANFFGQKFWVFRNAGASQASG